MDISKAATTVESALAKMRGFWPLHTVPADATAEAVVGMAHRFGVHHLWEATDGLERFGVGDWTKWVNVLGINVGAGQIEALFALLGAGRDRTVLVDRARACGSVAADLFAELGLAAPEFLVVDEIDQLARLTGPTLVVASHALNVNFADGEAQQKLEAQNDLLLATIAGLTDGSNEIAFFCLEPGGGTNQIYPLAKPWLAARPIREHANCRPSNRTKGDGVAKRAALLVLGHEVAVVSEPWVASRLSPHTFETAYHTFTVEYAPPQVKPDLQDFWGIGQRPTLELGEAAAVEIAFLEFIEATRSAAASEALELFGVDASDQPFFVEIGGQQ